MEMEIAATQASFLGEIGLWAVRTVVHEAAFCGQTLLLQRLIQCGASVNTVSSDNVTPLHDACMQGKTQCVRLLLEAGAAVDVRTVHGSTALCNACAAGSPECVKLLLEHGATANPTLTALTATPLHEACIQGNVDCVRLMIAGGAQLEAYNIHFGMPLHAACARQHVDCVRELLNAGANVNAVWFHETALHIAAKENNVHLIEMLVAFGGKMNARDKRGKRPIDYTRTGSPSALCLQQYECPPSNLQHLCRLALRNTLGKSMGMVVSKHYLPRFMLSYLYCA